MSEFGKSYTRDQFKAINKCQKIMFNKMNVRGSNEPLFYKNEDGTPTSVQKVAVTDEAGNLIATCSKELASDLLKGISPKTKGDVVFTERLYDAENQATGEVEQRVSYSLHYRHQSPNALDISEDIF